jgi:hypothetical protein
MEASYTLKISSNGEHITTRSSDSLSRLTTCLFHLLDHNVSDAIGEIIHNETGKVVKKHVKPRK